MQYKIHPAVGVARLGSSSEWFLGPTTPGVLADPGGSYRDGTPQKRLKAQAAGFWVFEHPDGGGAPVQVKVGSVIAGKTVAGIEWTVHLANKKAFWFGFHGLTGSKDVTNPPGYGYGPTPDSWRNSDITDPAARRKQLIIDFGPRTVKAPGGAATFDAASAAGYPVTGPGELKNAAGKVRIDGLGTLAGQPDGWLVVVPAPGVSGSTNGSQLVNFANNPGWFDNTSDGPVRAAILFTDGTRQEVDQPAWVLVGPPDFAPGVTNVVTLFDVMSEVGVRFFGTRPEVYSGKPPAGVNDFTSSSPPFNAAYRPSYRDEIYPILRRAADTAWVQARTAGVHDTWDFDALAAQPYVDGSNPVAPADIFKILRRPEDWNPTTSKRLMPLLLGDEDSPTQLTLTPTQYHLMRQWSLGKFDRTGWKWPLPKPMANPNPRAADLDRAALEACAGGAFYPGIEAGWIAREPKLYVQPFQLRFKHPPAGAGGPLGLDAGAVPDALYPGDLTKRMACPWQSDFWKCQGQWWPAQRPDEVIIDPKTQTRDSWARAVNKVGGTAVSGHMGMAVNWHQLGIVVPMKVEDKDIQAETERTLPS